MAITDWPADERPREKLLERGAESLSNAELLAIFLRTGVPGKSAVDLGRELCVQFGSLRCLLNAEAAEFTAVRGIGSAGGFRMMVEDHAGAGPAALQQAVGAMMAKAAQTPGLSQVFSLFENATPQIYLDIESHF